MSSLTIAVARSSSVRSNPRPTISCAPNASNHPGVTRPPVAIRLTPGASAGSRIPQATFASDEVRKAGGRNRRDARQPGEHVVNEWTRVAKARMGRREIESCDHSLVCAGRKGRHERVQRAQAQRTDEQKDQRYGDLQDHERSPEPFVRDPSVLSLFQPRGDGMPRGKPRRRES